MEKALRQYTLEPSERPFDMKSIPLAMASVFEQKAGNNSVKVFYVAYFLQCCICHFLLVNLTELRWMIFFKLGFLKHFLVFTEKEEYEM